VIILIVINFLDGEQIEVRPDTVLIGINNASKSEDRYFYLEKMYTGNLQGDYEKNGSALSTADERLGIGGFLLSHDMFSIGEGDDKTFYFTSAVKSISVL
jgi:hypothetical protein